MKKSMGGGGGNDKVEWKKSYWSSPVNYVGQLVVGYSIFLFAAEFASVIPLDDQTSGKRETETFL